MVDSAIKYFFSADGLDKRGVQFADAMERGKLAEMIQVKNFIPDPRVSNLGLFDNDVHPEIVQFIVDVGNYHEAIQNTSFEVFETETAAGAPGKLLFENVIKVFNTLPTEVQNFYSKYMNISVISGPGAVKGIELSAFEPSKFKPDTVFLNMKKYDSSAVGKTSIRFAEGLSQIQVSSKSIFGIKYAGAPIVIPTLNVAYVFALDSKLAVNPAQRLGNPAIGFTVDLRAIIKASLAKSNQGYDGEDLPSSSILDISTGDVIDVKDGKFIKKDGMRILPVDIEKNNCYTTQFKGNDAECHKFIYELILNEDADSFNKYFSNFNDSLFAIRAKDEILNINPDIAVRLLKKFGFNINTIPTLSGRSVQKFESLYEWMKRLDSTGVSKGTIDNIRKATHLKTYLELLVHFVNNNPSILNSGVGASDRRVEPDEVDANSYLGRTKIAMIPRIPIGEPVGDKHEALLKIATNASMAHRLLAMPASIPYPFPMVKLPGMVGGGNASALRPMIRGIISDLARKGKKLRQADQDILDEHLNTLEKLEKAITKISQQLSEYKDWSAIFPSQANEIVSLGSIENSIDKYRGCVAQHANLELGLINVARQMCQL